MVNRWYVVYFPPFVSESISFVPPNYKGIIKFLLLDIPVSNVYEYGWEFSVQSFFILENVLENVEKPRYRMIVD